MRSPVSRFHLLEPPLISPAVMQSAVNPAPVPNVRQSKLPSLLTPDAILKPPPLSCIAVAGVRLGRICSSSGTLDTITPCSKLSYLYAPPASKPAFRVAITRLR